MTADLTGAERVFWRITGWPRTILCAGLLVIVGLGLFVPSLTTDTTPDAFIADDNPAIVYRDRVRQMFGLEDPYIIAVVDEGPDGVFNRDTLALVATLTRAIQRLPMIDPDRVTSLATERDIVGTEAGMMVEPFLPNEEGGTLDPARVRAAVADFPLYQGTLVARDGSATLIIAETVAMAADEPAYRAIKGVVDGMAQPEGVSLHIAGEGAISGYLGAYIDADAKRLNPLAAVVITLVLVMAFRSVAGAVLPNIIVMATLAVAFGLMAITHVPFYVITNSLTAILIGIAVADSIHILSEYQDRTVRHPDQQQRLTIVRTMAAMWWPVTITTVTTIAGFAGIWLGADMPPMEAFGIFAAIGVGVAWIYTMTVLPAALVLFGAPKGGRRAADLFGPAMEAFGRFVLAHPRAVVTLSVLVAVVGVIGATRVIIEESAIGNFQQGEPIVIADEEINGRFDGTNYLDIVVETDRAEGLFDPERLRRIAALQAFAATLPGVQGSTSIVDYVKQMHRAVNGHDRKFAIVPDDPDMIAQLFLLYSTTGEPTDFQEEVDYAYQRAHVRLHLNTNRYRANRAIIEALNRYLADTFAGSGMTGALSGRVYVNHHWLDTIAGNHVRSVVISLVLVWLTAAAVFRSAVGGTLAMVPVVFSVLLIYGVMGFGGIWLGVGTSMFAAIAIGLGVDFAVHALHRMQTPTGETDDGTEGRILAMYRGTGRALFFNCAAVALGFLVLASSSVPPLARFGALVALAVTVSFVAALVTLPALVALCRPAFLDRRVTPLSGCGQAPVVRSGGGLSGVAVLAAALTAGAASAGAQDPMSADAIMARVVARDDGRQMTRTLHMAMTDRQGTTRERETVSYVVQEDNEKKTVIFYTEPRNVKGTAFLTYDYSGAGTEDDQWLYLPALRKVRRISASDRGDYFLGTDFTYEDIKKENKVALEDYRFRRFDDGNAEVDGHATIAIEGVPADNATARELGYGRAVWHIDPAIWIARRTEMWDINGNPLKTINNDDIRKVDGIWTVHRIEAENHKTGHRTVFEFSDVDYATPVDPKMFETRRLERGP
jgi:hypothetical protein